MMKNHSRRQLLRSLAASGSAFALGKNLPEVWSRPVVDSVLLPAHAYTSDRSYVATGVVKINDLIETLVPSAHANNLPKNICINLSGGVASVQVQYGNPGPVYSGSSPLPFDLVLSSTVSITGDLDPGGESISGNVTAGGTTSPYTAPVSSASCGLVSQCSDEILVLPPNESFTNQVNTTCEHLTTGEFTALPHVIIEVTLYDGVTESSDVVEMDGEATETFAELAARYIAEIRNSYLPQCIIAYQVTSMYCFFNIPEPPPCPSCPPPPDA